MVLAAVPSSRATVGDDPIAGQLAAALDELAHFDFDGAYVAEATGTVGAAARAGVPALTVTNQATNPFFAVPGLSNQLRHWLSLSTFGHA